MVTLAKQMSLVCPILEARFTYTAIYLLLPHIYLLATLALLKSHLYLTGCLYSGSSKSLRGGNVTKNQAARVKCEAQDSCGELCKNMRSQGFEIVQRGLR